MVSIKSPFWATVASIMPGSMDGSPVTRAQIDALPYASVMAWFENTPKAFMVLGEVTANGSLVWVSSNRQILVTRGPFVVRTAGLPEDLTEVRFTDDRIPDLLAAQGTQSRRRIDIQKAQRFDMVLNSFYGRGRPVELTIMGQSHAVLAIDETVQLPDGKKITNTYWVDPETGFCWKSLQNPVPGQPALNLEILKPFAGGPASPA